MKPESLALTTFSSNRLFAAILLARPRQGITKSAMQEMGGLFGLANGEVDIVSIHITHSLTGVVPVLTGSILWFHTPVYNGLRNLI
jgi:hypothetical protein